MKKVKAKIADDAREWKETFDVPDSENPEEYIKEIIKSYNDTLRPGEAPRKLVEILEERIDSRVLTDYTLAVKLLTGKQELISKISRLRLDEVNGEDADDTISYLKKEHNLNRLLEYWYEMRTAFRLTDYEGLLEEALRRKWKTERKAKAIIKKEMEE